MQLLSGGQGTARAAKMEATAHNVLHSLCIRRLWAALSVSSPVTVLRTTHLYERSESPISTRSNTRSMLAKSTCRRRHAVSTEAERAERGDGNTLFHRIYRC